MTAPDRAIRKLKLAFWEYDDLSEEIAAEICITGRISFKLIHEAVELKKVHKKATKVLIRYRNFTTRQH